jgi:hypothetical protein
MFEIPSPFAMDTTESQHDSFAESAMRGAIRHIATGGGQKIFLPRRSGECRLAPRQYYYPASRSGVVPGSSIHRGHEITAVS